MLFNVISCQSQVAGAAAFLALFSLSGCGSAGVIAESQGEDQNGVSQEHVVVPEQGEARAAKGPRAVSEIKPLAGSQVYGTAKFTWSQGQVTAVIHVENAPPGPHGIHIHQFGNCDNNGMAAGEHWNPTNEPHGLLNHRPAHLGDLGNIYIRPDGTGTLVFKSEKWAIGGASPHDIVGHSIIIHTERDDLATQPSGASGGRIACGVIEELSGRE